MPSVITKAVLATSFNASVTACTYTPAFYMACCLGQWLWFEPSFTSWISSYLAAL